MAKLRLRGCEGKLYPHLGSQDAGTKRFLGHKFKLVAPGPTPDLDRYGFEHQPDEVHELDLNVIPREHAREYAMAVADGDLLAADEETAKLCTRLTGKPCAFHAPTPAHEERAHGAQE